MTVTVPPLPAAVPEIVGCPEVTLAPPVGSGHTDDRCGPACAEHVGHGAHGDAAAGLVAQPAQERVEDAGVHRPVAGHAGVVARARGADLVEDHRQPSAAVADHCVDRVLHHLQRDGAVVRRTQCLEREGVGRA